MAKKIAKPKKSKVSNEKTIVAIKQAQEDKLSEAVMMEAVEKKMTPKFKAWAALYMDRDNKEYWGNATKCALSAYNTTNIASASNIGYENVRKLEIIMGTFLEFEGMGMGEMVKIGAAKMLAGSFADWKEMMIMSGFYKPPAREKEGGNTFNFANLNVAIMNDRKARGLEN